MVAGGTAGKMRSARRMRPGGRLSWTPRRQTCCSSCTRAWTAGQVRRRGAGGQRWPRAGAGGPLCAMQACWWDRFRLGCFRTRAASCSTNPHLLPTCPACSRGPRAAGTPAATPAGRAAGGPAGAAAAPAAAQRQASGLRGRAGLAAFGSTWWLCFNHHNQVAQPLHAASRPSAGGRPACHRSVDLCAPWSAPQPDGCVRPAAALLPSLPAGVLHGRSVWNLDSLGSWCRLEC